MADLEDLDGFDRENRLAIQDINALIIMRRSNSGTWSGNQDEQFAKLLGAVVHLQAALSELVARNR